MCSVAILLYCARTFAYCRVPEIRANGEFFKADVVLTGTVLSQKFNGGGWFYHIQTEEVLKGPTQSDFTVHTENASDRFPLKKGHQYLIFAYQQDGMLEIDSCGNSSLLSKVGKSLQRIQSIASAKDSEIEGWLAPTTSNVDVSGIHVVIRSESKVYYAITDKDGRFHFRVPPGSYSADFSNHEYYLNTLDVFWYDPEKFSVRPGETASIQMVSVRHPKK